MDTLRTNRGGTLIITPSAESNNKTLITKISEIQNKNVTIQKSKEALIKLLFAFPPPHSTGSGAVVVSNISICLVSFAVKSSIKSNSRRPLGTILSSSRFSHRYL